MKELLIEKYTEPSSVSDYIQIAILKQWFDKYGRLHRNNNLPALVYENHDSSVEAYFFKNGKQYIPKQKYVVLFQSYGSSYFEHTYINEENAYIPYEREEMFIKENELVKSSDHIPNKKELPNYFDSS